MTDVAIRTEGWRTLPWKDYQRNVYRLQQRILRLRSGQVLSSRTTGRLAACPQAATAVASFMVSTPPKAWRCGR